MTKKKMFHKIDTWILVDDVHQDAVDVAPKLGVDLLLVLQRCPELPQKLSKINFKSLEKKKSSTALATVESQGFRVKHLA